MNSLNFAIDAIKEKTQVSNFGIIGFGQGGLASVLLASQRTDLLCVVCSNGGYDLLRHKVPDDALMSILQKSDYDLDVEDDEALAARSAILHITSIDAPVFLLHRKGNPIVGKEEVVDFFHAMLAAGKECYLSLKEKTPEVDAQKLSYEEVLAETEEWVDSNMRD
jgi:dipeptidyl aminopeptidase/acylaminoacyl peptidase